jgi:[acyl-carrier-protein] S-malonyltransferase
MTAPVRWEEAVQRMTALGVGTFVEMGPRDVLTGLVRRIAPQCRAVATDGRDPQEVVSELGRGDGG